VTSPAVNQVGDRVEVSEVAEKKPIWARPAAVERTVSWTFLAAVGVFLTVGALLASTLPYSGWDPYFYGQWSRLIGAHGGFHFPGVGAVYLHRPLLYVVQGEVWRVFGYHMALGRFVSLAFTLLLIVAVGLLAAGRSHRLLRAAIAVLVTALIADVAIHASDGLTDIPAAAMVALAAVVLWRMPDRRVRLGLLVCAGLLAVLAKPSGIVGIAGLLIAQTVGPRETLRPRLERNILPLAAGLLLGIGYDWSQARHEHMGLLSFVQSGVGSGLWAQKAAAYRPQAVYGWWWLGGSLHVLLIFAVAYALLRVAGLPHRVASVLGIALTWFWAWYGASLSGIPFHPGTDSPGIATWLVTASLVLVVFAPESTVPSRIDLARLLLWALPSVLIWVKYAAYDTRLISAAWPALILLISGAVIMIIVTASRRKPFLAAVPAAALVLLAVNNVYNLNGLGQAGWQQYRSGGLSGLSNPRLMENIALGQFQQELDPLRSQLGPNDRIIGSDGRLGFFFPGRVDDTYPVSCSALRGYRAFVLLMSDESIATAQTLGAPATEEEWAACKSPRLKLVATIPSNFAVFTIGTP
jgi:hypothetical protein